MPRPEVFNFKLLASRLKFVCQYLYFLSECVSEWHTQCIELGPWGQLKMYHSSLCQVSHDIPSYYHQYITIHFDSNLNKKMPRKWTNIIWTNCQTKLQLSVVQHTTFVCYQNPKQMISQHYEHVQLYLLNVEKLGTTECFGTWFHHILKVEKPGEKVECCTKYNTLK